jgi:hypothetical protein
MSSLGCRSIPSRVILQIQVDELLLECLNIDLTWQPLELFPVARIVRVPQPGITGRKAQICDAGHNPPGIDSSRFNPDCV